MRNRFNSLFVNNQIEGDIKGVKNDYIFSIKDAYSKALIEKHRIYNGPIDYSKAKQFLSAITPEEISRAIIHEDSHYLTYGASVNYKECFNTRPTFNKDTTTFIASELTKMGFNIVIVTSCIYFKID